MFKFIKRVFKAAIKSIVSFIKSLTTNAAGVCILVGATVGFTKLATEIPFYVALPLWIESTMVAPLIGLFVVFLLIHAMRLQLKLQGAAI